MSFFYLSLAFMLNSLANILLKLSANRGLELGSFNPFKLVAHNSLFLLGLIFFALNAFFYFLALKTIPLSVAYPIMIAASLLLIDSFALIYLKEILTFWQLIGYLFIILGLFLVFIFRLT